MASAREQFGGEKVLTYHDYRKLLENKDIDAVIVGTNGHWHILPTIHACQAGKDVYVEKPLGTSIGEGRAAVQAARKYNRIVQLGTQQRSWPHYKQAVEAIQAGKLGEISEVKVWDFDYMYPGFGNPPDGDPPAGTGLGLLARPGPESAVQPEPLRTSLLVHRLRRRVASRLGRPPLRHRALGLGLSGAGRRDGHGRHALL